MTFLFFLGKCRDFYYISWTKVSPKQARFKEGMEGHQIAAVAAEQREYGLMSESFFACNLSALAEATVRRTSAISVAVSDPLRVESTVRKSNRLNIWHRLASISTLRLVSKLDTNG